MTKNIVSKTTINYAAKQAYQLFVTRGITKAHVAAGLKTTYFHSEVLNKTFILVEANGILNPIEVKKTWINLI